MGNEKETFTLLIALHSCNGEEKEFAEWVESTYPEVTTEIKNTINGGLYNENGDRVEEGYYGYNFWDKYCSA